MRKRAASAVIVIGLAALRVSGGQADMPHVVEPPCVDGHRQTTNADPDQAGHMRLRNIVRDPALQRELAIEAASGVLGSCREPVDEECDFSKRTWIDGRGWACPAPFAAIRVRAPITERIPLVGHDGLLQLPEDRDLDERALTPNVISTRGLDRLVIRRFIKHRMPEIERCYAARDRAFNEGTVFLNFVITPHGAVQHARHFGFDPSVASCVDEIVDRIAFPPALESSDVRLAFSFKPSIRDTCATPPQSAETRFANLCGNQVGRAFAPQS